MYSKFWLVTLGVVLLGSSKANGASLGSDNSQHPPSAVIEPFSLSPSKCVALNEGRTCFADVVFSLNLPDKREYCVRIMGEVTPIGCWRAAESVSYLYSFASSTSTTYELVNRTTGDVIATQTIEVNWVHKIQTKKRRWRLF